LHNLTKQISYIELYLTPEEEAEVAHMEIKLGKRFSAGEL
jgi:hypothetical protein